MQIFFVLTGQPACRMTQPITAWLSIGSTYIYLTALRENAIQLKETIKLAIGIRKIMKSMDNIPFPPFKKALVN